MQDANELLLLSMQTEERGMVPMLRHPVSTGDQLDHYRIDRVVARTNTDTIFHAMDLRTNAQVAIKMPHPELETDPTFADRFKREEEIGERLDHPGVVKVIPERHRTQHYLVLEWVEGKTLREVISEEKISQDRAIRITIAICKVLEYIHNHGIVHRDLRPEHILIDGADNIKLIHFGRAAQAVGRRITFTNVSQIIGASPYISPEELKGKRGDARSDIYALGTILYEMVTGRLPFPDSNPFDRTLNYPMPPREINPAITPQLQEVIYRATERDPSKRYANAHNFDRDLEHLEEVGVADRDELRTWKRRRSPLATKLLLYGAITLIPIVIFVLMIYFASHKN